MASPPSPVSVSACAATAKDRQPTFRAHLIALAGVSLITVAGIGSWAVREAVHGQRGAFRDRLLDTAGMVSSVVDQQIGSHLSTLATLAASNEIDESDLQAIWEQARKTADVTGVADYSLSTPEGHRIFSTNRTFGDPVPDSPAANAITKAARTGRPIISDLVRSNIDRRPLVIIAYPVIRDGDVRYVLTASVTSTRFSAVLTNHLTSGTQTTIIDGQGVALAGSNPSSARVGNRANPEIFKAASSNPPPVLTSGLWFGELRIVAFHPVLGTGWTVAVSGPLTAYQAAWQSPLLRLIPGGLIALAVAAGAVYVISRRMLAPIDALRRYSQTAAAGGGFPIWPKVPATVREFAELSLDLARLRDERQKQAILTMNALVDLADAKRRSDTLVAAGASMTWRATLLGDMRKTEGWDRITGQTEEQSSGRGWLRAVHPEDQAQVATTFNSHIKTLTPGQAEYRVATQQGWRWLRTRFAPVYDEAGRALEWVGASEDITARKAAELALAEREASLRLAVEGARMATWTYDLESDQGCAVMDPTDMKRSILPDGYSAATFYALVHAEDRDRVCATFEAALRSEDGYFASEYRISDGKDGWRWVSDHAAVVERNGTTGAPKRVSGVIQDISARKRAEERQERLAREVDHRAKNALAVVQAVLRLTRHDDKWDYIKSVEGRVSALLRAQAALAAGDWRGGSVRWMAQAELTQWIADNDGGRVSLDGPDIFVGPDAVQPLSIILHELTANAVAHGALSNSKGRIRVRWSASTGGGALVLRWLEDDGPPVLGGTPIHQGFGLTLLGRIAQAQLGGSIDFTWRQKGVLVHLTIAPSHVRPLGEATAA